MITVKEYFGVWMHNAEVTEEKIAAAEKLIAAVNLLLGFAAYDQIPMPVNPATNSQISGLHNGGFRLRECTEGSEHSSHKEARGVDVFDPGGHLDDWITDAMLASCGLYREHPTATHGWCHLTIRAPSSKHRTFYP